MKIEESIKWGISILKGVVEKPKLESEMLLCSILNVERIYLHMNFNEELSEKSYKKFQNFIEKRSTNYPIEYIIERASFYSKDFLVKEGVLIPRPETEILVDLVANKIRENNIKTVAEIGVGSGIISVTLASMFPDVKFIGSDINPKAIDLAINNATYHAVEMNTEFRLGSKLDVIDEDIDLLVSNPPYIEDTYELPENVKFEPKEALFGGTRGDEFIKEIIDLVVERKIKTFICEFGYDQKQFILDYCDSKGYNTPSFYQDLSNLDRGFTLE